MTTDTNERAAAIFLALSRVPPDERARRLAEQCGGDDALRVEVERLLDGLDLPDSFLEAPATPPPLHGGDIAQPAGTTIGDFVVFRQIGAGGTGVVYLAQQRHPSRTVALKMLRREYMASSVQRRFAIEAEILGRLHHPGIAQIYAAHPGDATTPPYIAMELVNGPSLVEFADNRRLSVRDRVELVAFACDAVQHAHQHGIIHRDLKPGNILVDEDGQPKVLDFGIARTIGGQVPVTTVQTETGQLLGTLAYMSPEQVQAVPDAIDTRTDIYALGVILFRLLAGRLPFGHDDPPLPELARRIAQDEPPKLGTLDPTLRGDLDVIVARALAKEKERRYASASALASDLRRYLAQQPISASADSAWYVVRRQLGRYRLAFGLSATMLVVVSALAFYAILQRARVDDINRRLEDQLMTSTIEQARLIGITGNYPAAEELAWREFFRRPDSRQTRWTLWEIYSREPNTWTRIVHDTGTQTVRFSPDGRFLLTAGRLDGVMQLVDAESGQPVRTLTATPRSGTRRALFTQNGKTIVSGTEDGTLRQWDVATGELRREIPKAMPELFDLAISADGAEAVTVALAHVEVWSFATGARRLDLSGLITPASSAGVSPVGPIAVIGSDRGELVAADLRRGSPLWKLKGHSGLVTSVAFTADGRLVATGGTDGMVYIWNSATGERVRAIRTDDSRVRNLSLDRRGTLLAVTGPRRSRVWDLTIPDAPARDVGASEGMTDVHLRPDGLAMATCNGGSGQVRVWDLAADPRSDRWQQAGSVRALGVAGDGRSVVTAGNGGVSTWRPAQPDPVRVFRSGGNVYGFDFSRNGQWMVTAGAAGSAAVWDTQDDRRLAALPEVRTSRSVIFADNDRLILAGQQDGTLTTWTWSEGVATLTRRQPSADGDVLAVAAQGSHAFVAHTDHLVAVLDVRSGKELGRLKTASAPYSVAVAPDGGVVAAGTYLGAVEVWDVATGRHLDSVKGQTTIVNGVDFSPDSTLLAISSRDGSTRLWDVAARQPLAVVASRKIAAEHVRFLADGQQLAIGYSDGEVDVVDLNHFLRHVAGNAEYRLRLFRDAGESFPRADEVIAWSRQVLSVPGRAPGHVIR